MTELNALQWREKSGGKNHAFNKSADLGGDPLAFLYKFLKSTDVIEDLSLPKRYKSPDTALKIHSLLWLTKK